MPPLPLPIPLRVFKGPWHPRLSGRSRRPSTRPCPCRTCPPGRGYTSHGSHTDCTSLGSDMHGHTLQSAGSARRSESRVVGWTQLAPATRSRVGFEHNAFERRRAFGLETPKQSIGDKERTQHTKTKHRLCLEPGRAPFWHWLQFRKWVFPTVVPMRPLGHGAARVHRYGTDFSHSFLLP